MGFEPMTSRLSAERANQAVPLAYKYLCDSYLSTLILMLITIYNSFGKYIVFQ